MLTRPIQAEKILRSNGLGVRSTSTRDKMSPSLPPRSQFFLFLYPSFSCYSFLSRKYPLDTFIWERSLAQRFWIIFRLAFRAASMYIYKASQKRKRFWKLVDQCIYHQNCSRLFVFVWFAISFLSPWSWCEVCTGDQQFLSGFNDVLLNMSSSIVISSCMLTVFGLSIRFFKIQKCDRITLDRETIEDIWMNDTIEPHLSLIYRTACRNDVTGEGYKTGWCCMKKAQCSWFYVVWQNQI